jgi:hypothetical protein
MMIVNGLLPGETRSKKHRPKRADNGHSIVESSTTLHRSGWGFRYAVTCECGKRYTSKQDHMRAIRSWEKHKEA